MISSSFYFESPSGSMAHKHKTHSDTGQRNAQNTVKTSSHLEG